MLSDPVASRVLLVGTAEYVTLDSLPAVENNLAGLRSALTDPEIWGLPPENCAILPQPDSADALLNALQEVGSAATDTLVFYYAGHGLVDPGNDDELHLALPGSDMERAFRTAVPYSWVRREIQAARARRKVVILDCCYSGRALGRWMAGDVDLADRLDIDGTCVLTATARTRRALAPPDQSFTAFTGELIAILTGGVPDGPGLLDMDTLYRHLTVRLRAKSLPLPQRGQLDRGGDIVLARNQAVTARLAASPSAEEPTRGLAETHEEALHTAQLRAWRQSVDTSRQPVVRGIRAPAGKGEKRVERISLLLLLAWTGLAVWLAWAREPVVWLAISAAVGFVSFLLTRRMVNVLDKNDDDDWWVVGVWIICIIGTLALYCVTAFVFTGDWTTRGWAIGAMLSFVFIILMRLYAGLEASTVPDINKRRDNQLAVAEATRMKRWLREADPEDAGSGLLEPLTDIPAARFAALAEGCFPFLAIAGSRIVLLAFTNWPPGVYTRHSGTVTDIRRNGNYFQAAADELSTIATSAKEWQSQLPRATFRIVVVVRPSISTRASGIVLQIPDPVDDEILAFAAPDTFEDVAGEFLAAEAYILNIPILEKLLSLIKSSKDV